MKTAITELLGIEYPIIQGGMAWVGTHELAAAVSEAGGLGIIGSGGAPASWVREQIQAVKEATDKPFGVNVMLMNPEADQIAQVIVDEKGAGSDHRRGQSGEIHEDVAGSRCEGDPGRGQCGPCQTYGENRRGRASRKEPSPADISVRPRPWR